MWEGAIQITNIHSAEWQRQTGSSGAWSELKLPFEHLGVRVESLEPGAKSSHHHYHSLEEEHLLVLEGRATLHMDSGDRPLKGGDHVFFPAGSDDAHHIENTSDEPFKFFVFGERREDDVVYYPRDGKKLLKGAEKKLVDIDGDTSE